MNKTTEILLNMRRIIKLQDVMMKKLTELYQLTPVEAKIITFLHNNPNKDTAADIAELRMLHKGNVSQAVETLYQKEFLTRNQDKTDRRKIHLSLTEKADPIVQLIDEQQDEFYEEIFSGLSQEDRETFIKINAKIRKNIQKAVEKREQ